MACTCHDITKSAGSLTNNKSSDHNCRILQQCLSKDLSQRLQTHDLRKQESIRKIPIWSETDASAQSPF